MPRDAHFLLTQRPLNIHPIGMRFGRTLPIWNDLMQPIGAPPPSTARSTGAVHGACGADDPSSLSYLVRRSATSACRWPWRQFANGWNALVVTAMGVRDCDDAP